mgnify:CR=1 FL=1
MKKCIQLLVLSTVFLLVSCSVENVEKQNIQEKIDVTNGTSQKLLEVSYNGHVNTADIEWLKEELNVEETIFGVKNKVIWVVNSPQSIEAITELLLFSDDIISVKEVSIGLSAAREGDFVKEYDDKEYDDKADEENSGQTNKVDTKRDGTTDSDEE